MRPLGLLMMALALASPMMASFAPVPEIDASSGIAAIALLSGGLVVIRARRKKQQPRYLDAKQERSL